MTERTTNYPPPSEVHWHLGHLAGLAGVDDDHPSVAALIAALDSVGALKRQVDDATDRAGAAEARVAALEEAGDHLASHVACIGGCGTTHHDWCPCQTVARWREVRGG